MKKDYAELVLKKWLAEYEDYKKRAEDDWISKSEREYYEFMTRYYRWFCDWIKIIIENIL